MWSTPIKLCQGVQSHTLLCCVPLSLRLDFGISMQFMLFSLWNRHGYAKYLSRVYSRSNKTSSDRQARAGPLPGGWGKEGLEKSHKWGNVWTPAYYHLWASWRSITIQVFQAIAPKQIISLVTSLGCYFFPRRFWFPLLLDWNAEKRGPPFNPPFRKTLYSNFPNSSQKHPISFVSDTNSALRNWLALCRFDTTPCWFFF